MNSHPFQQFTLLFFMFLKMYFQFTDNLPAMRVAKPFVMIFMSIYLYRNLRSIHCFFSNFILLGFILAIFGDLLLSLPGKISFLLSLFTFLGTHVCYLIASLSNIFDKTSKKKEYSVIPFLGCAILEGLALYMSNFVQKQSSDKIFIPMMVYAQILYIMTGSYFFRYEKTSFLSFIVMIVGAISFAASDCLLAFELLLKLNDWLVAFLINVFYYMAQELLYIGTLSHANYVAQQKNKID